MRLRSVLPATLPATPLPPARAAESVVIGGLDGILYGFPRE